MTAPAYKATGSLISDAGSGKVVPWPAHVAGDIAILIGVQTNVGGGAADTLDTPAGFTLIGDVEGGPDGSLSNDAALDSWAAMTIALAPVPPSPPSIAPFDESQIIDEYDELALELDKRGYDG